MAIKKLRIAFDVPIAELLALMATRNDALHIDVIGDGKEDKLPKQLRQSGLPLLEGPARKRNKAQDEHGPLSTYQAIAIFLMKSPDHTGTMTAMKAALVPFGVNPVSISPQMGKMREDGNVKMIEKGTYRLTAAGVRNFDKMIKERQQGAQHE